MKLLKSFFIVMLLVSATAATAQENTAPQWRDLSNVEEVISRIARGNDEQNYEPLKGFAETLHNMAMNLSAKEIPAPYNSKKTVAAIKKLQKQTEALQSSAASKAPVGTLIAQFSAVKASYDEIAASKSK